MKKGNSSWKLLCIAFVLLQVTSCSISPEACVCEECDAEQTLQAIYMERTMTAEAPESEPESTDEFPSEADIKHVTNPGEPWFADKIKDEIDTAYTADRKFALGDSFRLSNFERPFTAVDMVYHPETDLVRILLSRDVYFYYFTIELSGIDEKKDYPSASYGIEMDTDRDGRGDYLLWAQGDSSTEWNINNVMLLYDSNGDVGGSRPVRPDNDRGNGYDEVIFSAEVLTDPDSAWKRVDPTNSSIIQLAVKSTLIDSSSFFWKAWADGGLSDPSLFDYNDIITESQAGSPNTNSKFYPVNGLNMMDSTCWIAYNFQPTGYELGGCVIAKPIQPPASHNPAPIVCNCDDGPDGLDEHCCNECFFWWNGETESCEWGGE